MKLDRTPGKGIQPGSICMVVNWPQGWNHELMHNGRIVTALERVTPGTWKPRAGINAPITFEIDLWRYQDSGGYIGPRKALPARFLLPITDPDSAHDLVREYIAELLREKLVAHIRANLIRQHN